MNNSSEEAEKFWALFEPKPHADWKKQFEKELCGKSPLWIKERINIKSLYVPDDVRWSTLNEVFSDYQHYEQPWRNIHYESNIAAFDILRKVQKISLQKYDDFCLDFTPSGTYKNITESLHKINDYVIHIHLIIDIEESSLINKVNGIFNMTNGSIRFKNHYFSENNFKSFLTEVPQFINRENFKSIVINHTESAHLYESTLHSMAAMLSEAAEIINEFSSKGIPAEKSLRHLQFELASDKSYFFSIATFRAFKILLKKFTEAYTTDNIHIPLHAVSAGYYKDEADMYRNLLMATTQAMAAVSGGADAIMLMPFDQGIKKPNDLSERITSNIFHILREESWMGKVTDPTAGSYYIESLTHSIMDETWKIFLHYENEGGFIKALKKGIIKTPAL